MNDSLVIRSKTNALLKRVGSALSGKVPGVLVLEGERLIDDALAAGIVLEVALVAEERAGRAEELARAGVSVRLVEAELLQRVSALETSPGVLALAESPASRELSSLNEKEASRVLVVCGLQDPGNLGALARSAEAAGFRALVSAGRGARPFGPKALRGSMGSLLRLKVYEVQGVESVAQQLRAEGFRQVCATTRGGTSWREFDWSGSLALWVSGETGIEPEVMKNFEGVSIPMAGEVESLNVTVATSLLLFAAAGVAL
ncbi:MAG: TrmH family RNA methyltransferase [Planctomycetota bacterium]|jgi:TrmH family RNA methyltransferase